MSKKLAVWKYAKGALALVDVRHLRRVFSIYHPRAEELPNRSYIWEVGAALSLAVRLDEVANTMILKWPGFSPSAHVRPGRA